MKCWEDLESAINFEINYYTLLLYINHDYIFIRKVSECRFSLFSTKYLKVEEWETLTGKKRVIEINVAFSQEL